MTKLIDLSYEITNGMITYTRFPTPIMTDFLSWDQSHGQYAEGVEFRVSNINLVATTGTYLDSPSHRHRNGLDIGSLSLDSLANLPGIIVHISQRIIDISVLENAIQKNKIQTLKDHAILINTDWSKHWGTDKYTSFDHPHLTADAAEFLVKSQVKIVGIDCSNIDDNSPDSQGYRPVHTTLLAHNILIIENLCNLSNITNKPFRFFAVPPKFKEMSGFPVRAFALQES